MLYEFWDEGSACARCFGLRTSHSTWSSLISAVGRHISTSLTREGAMWLDVGTGDGFTCSEIVQSVKGRFSICGRLCTVEPSASARRIQESVLPMHSNGGPVLARAESVEAVFGLRRTFAIVTLVHTAYYLASDRHGLERTMRRLQDLLSPGGSIACLALPKDSPMFQLGELGLYQVGFSEDIQKALRDLGRRVEKVRLGMKWYGGSLGWKSDCERMELDNIIRYVEGKRDLIFDDQRRSRFINRLATLSGRTMVIDFGDELIVGH